MPLRSASIELNLDCSGGEQWSEFTRRPVRRSGAQAEAFFA
jgi:hypothetical protein